MEIIKDTSNMGKLIIKEIDYNLAKDIIIKNHYSHKWNTSFGKVNVGIFKFEQPEKCLGVASFGNLMNPKSYENFNKLFKQESIIELNRLWIDDILGFNAETILLGASWKIIREEHKNIKAVQSFADGRLGCGTIYKASNFDYYGYEETLFYENIYTKEVYHKVPMENTIRPDGLIKLNASYCIGELKPFYVKTYRYVYPLYKNIKIELNKMEYPKYDKGIRYLDNYNHSEKLLFRALILAYILEYKKEFYIIKKYISDNMFKDLIVDNLIYALKNSSIIEISKLRKCIDKLNEIQSIGFDGLKLDDVEEKQLDIFDFIKGNEL